MSPTGSPPFRHAAKASAVAMTAIPTRNQLARMSHTDLESRPGLRESRRHVAGFHLLRERHRRVGDVARRHAHREAAPDLTLHLSVECPAAALDDVRPLRRVLPAGAAE